MKDNINNNIRELVYLITREMTSREDKKEKWAKFKNENNAALRELLGMPEGSGNRVGDLVGFDIHPEENLILLNYTSQAHNILHEIEGGWTPALRAMRGLVYSFGKNLEDIQLVSRGFDKFFNQSELPETSVSALYERCGDEKLICREKADGHMVEIFIHEDRLFATTRGKFGTLSAQQAMRMMNRAQWIKADLVARSLKQELMTLVVELITPESEVHVDYNGKETMFLLAAFDKAGSQIHDALLPDIVGTLPELFSLPDSVFMTLDEIFADVQDRNVENKEGWVVNCQGMLVKFKYETYIGKMVADKLSYKYIMRCIQKGRLEKMIGTLPEELREVADVMVSEVMATAKISAQENSHLPLYDLHSQLDGSVAYFRTVSREFWREWVQNQSEFFA